MTNITSLHKRHKKRVKKHSKHGELKNDMNLSRTRRQGTTKELPSSDSDLTLSSAKKRKKRKKSRTTLHRRPPDQTIRGFQSSGLEPSIKSGNKLTSDVDVRTVDKARHSPSPPKAPARRRPESAATDSNQGRKSNIKVKKRARSVGEVKHTDEASKPATMQHSHTSHRKRKKKIKKRDAKPAGSTAVIPAMHDGEQASKRGSSSVRHDSKLLAKKKKKKVKRRRPLERAETAVAETVEKIEGFESTDTDRFADLQQGMFLFLLRLFVV